MGKENLLVAVKHHSLRFFMRSSNDRVVVFMAVEKNIAIAELFKRHSHFIAGIKDRHTFRQNDIDLVAHDISHLLGCSNIVNFQSNRFRHPCDDAHQTPVVGQTFIHQLHSSTFKNSCIQHTVDQQALAKLKGTGVFAYNTSLVKVQTVRTRQACVLATELKQPSNDFGELGGLVAAHHAHNGDASGV